MFFQTSKKFFLVVNLLLAVCMVGFIIISNISHSKGVSMKASEHIKSVVMGPGAGEYVYDTDQSQIKQTVAKMLDDYPNLEKVSIVVGWFGDTKEAGKIEIAPKVESKEGQSWAVGEYTRDSAERVSVDSGGNIKWGGTPTDESIMEVCALLKEKGIDVVLYPMLFIDDEDKSWRGEIEAKTDEDVDHFFDEYNEFVMHYANLEQDGVQLKSLISDFIIGSEMEGMTSYRNSDNEFKSVEKLKELAADVREAVGADVKLTYAANWTEYHHTEGGWYHMDALWADKNIDYIGIDAYFRLTDEETSGNINPESIKEGWQSGIDYDYYTDGDKQVPLQDKYAVKNFEWFWKNEHVNPDGTKTEWQPGMKPISFTETGFTAIDKTTNEPYKYSDPATAGATLPENSTGDVDPAIQYDAVVGTINFINEIAAKEGNEGMIADITWYNIDPKGQGTDFAHNHELKVAEYEDSLGIYDDDTQIAGLDQTTPIPGSTTGEDS